MCSPMNHLVTVWALATTFLLPWRMGHKVMAAIRDQEKTRAWRAGKVMFYGGILVWSPYALTRKLLGLPVPVAPFLTAHFLLMYGGLALQRWASGGASPR